jgi:hypothetical protein
VTDNPWIKIGKPLSSKTCFSIDGAPDFYARDGGKRDLNAGQ